MIFKRVEHWVMASACGSLPLLPSAALLIGAWPPPTVAVICAEYRTVSREDEPVAYTMAFLGEREGTNISEDDAVSAMERIGLFYRLLDEEARRLDTAKGILARHDIAGGHA